MNKLVWLVAFTLVLAGMDEAFARGGRGGGGRSGGVSRAGGSSFGGNRGATQARPSSRSGSAVSNRGTSSRVGSSQGLNSSRTGASKFQSKTPGTARSNFGGNGKPAKGDLQGFLNLPQGQKQTKISESGIKTKSPFEKGSKFTEKTGKQFGEQAQGKLETAKADGLQSSEERRSQWSEQKTEKADQVRQQSEEWANKITESETFESLHDEYHNQNSDWQDLYEEYPGYFWMQTAKWAAVGGWMLNEAVSEPYAYNYGTSTYSEGGQVYYEEEAVATTEEYAEQAYSIAEALPEQAPENVEWMPLGLFALKTSNTADTHMIVQLAVSKEGFLVGTYFNKTTETSLPIEGTVDKETQRAAWKLADGLSPMVMETGLYDLTLDETVALVHFGTNRTEEWLMVRLEDPNASKTNNSTASK